MFARASVNDVLAEVASDPPQDTVPVASPAVASVIPEPEIDTCTVIYTFEAQEPDELDVKEGETVAVIGNYML